MATWMLGRACIGLAGVACIVCLNQAVEAAESTASESNLPATATADTGSTEGLAEIIVTAEHKVSTVQTTPIAVSAFEGGDLGTRDIVDIQGLTGQVPNMEFGQLAFDARIFIRGVGLDSESQGLDGRVALYTDEVYNARPQAALSSFYDVDRVEILRGPQGTLYGRNATAGAINIISNDPSNALEGYAKLTVGNYGLVGTEGAVSGPLSDTVSARVAFQTIDTRGYGVNIQSGTGIDDEHPRSVRGKLKYKPNDDFNILVTADYHTENAHSGGFRYIGPTPGNVDPTIALGYTYANNARNTAGFGPRNTLDTYGISAISNANFGETQLVSVSAYRHFDSLEADDPEVTTAPFFQQYYSETSNQYSQELRMLRTFGPIDLTVGGYFFEEKDIPENSDPTAPILIGLPETGLYQGFALGGTQTTRAEAGFFQGTAHLTDHLGLDLGGRYSHESKSLDEYFQTDLSRPYNPGNPFLGTCLSPLACYTGKSQNASWSSFDPKITLHDELAKDVFGYATYSSGFKSGGFNIGGLQDSFQPEKLKDYELGIKADMFNHRLRTNFSAFYYKYSNLQVNVTQGLALVTTNAAKARLYGVEAEISALPVDQLRLSLNGGWLYSEYLDYMNVFDPAHNGIEVNLSGNELTNAPRFQATFDVGYTFHAPMGDLTPRVNASWTDKIYFSSFNVPYSTQSPRTELNLYLDVLARNGWSGSVFIKNATNNLYVIAEEFSASIQGYSVIGLYGPPRTIGASLTKHF